MEKHAMVIDGEDDLPQMVFEKNSIDVGKITFDTKTTEAHRRTLKPGAKIKVGDKVAVIAASDEK